MYHCQKTLLLGIGGGVPLDSHEHGEIQDGEMVSNGEIPASLTVSYHPPPLLTVPLFETRARIELA